LSDETITPQPKESPLKLTLRIIWIAVRLAILVIALRKGASFAYQGF
jgi:hypothetical protein